MRKADRQLPKTLTPLPRCLSPEAEALWVRYHWALMPIMDWHPDRCTADYEAWHAAMLPLWTAFTAKVAKL